MFIFKGLVVISVGIVVTILSILIVWGLFYFFRRFFQWAKNYLVILMEKIVEGFYILAKKIKSLWQKYIVPIIVAWASLDDWTFLYTMFLVLYLLVSFVGYFFLTSFEAGRVFLK